MGQERALRGAGGAMASWVLPLPATAGVREGSHVCWAPRGLDEGRPRAPAALPRWLPAAAVGPHAPALSPAVAGCLGRGLAGAARESGGCCCSSSAALCAADPSALAQAGADWPKGKDVAKTEQLLTYVGCGGLHLPQEKEKRDGGAVLSRANGGKATRSLVTNTARPPPCYLVWPGGWVLWFRHGR